MCPNLLGQYAGRIIKRIEHEQNLSHTDEKAAVQQIGRFHEHSSPFIFIFRIFIGCSGIVLIDSPESALREIGIWFPEID